MLVVFLLRCCDVRKWATGRDSESLGVVIDPGYVFSKICGHGGTWIISGRCCTVDTPISAICVVRIAFTIFLVVGTQLRSLFAFRIYFLLTANHELKTNRLSSVASPQLKTSHTSLASFSKSDPAPQARLAPSRTTHLNRVSRRMSAHGS